jgi:hypothetical protein
MTKVVVIIHGMAVEKMPVKRVGVGVWELDSVARIIGLKYPSSCHDLHHVVGLILS